MKHILKRLTAALLTATMLAGVIPLQAMAIEAAKPETVTLDDGYLQLEVSTENGGFHINTLEGDKLIKSDDNKFLLYPDDYFDSSYTSFRITKDGGEEKDYIFGRSYGFAGSDVSVTKDDATNTITSVWTVDGVRITQTMFLLSDSAEQHGMVNISYTVEAPAGEDIEVEARLLMDTALGYQDYGVYELAVEGDGNTESIYFEQLERGGLSSGPYNNMFFAYDNPTSPKVTAYLVDGTMQATGGDVEDFTPYMVAFGHWNNLASSVFDFTPDSEMNFTNPMNEDYLTADSAFATYYDLGMINGGEAVNFSTNYGVFSNSDKSINSEVVMNFTSNSVSMELNEDKTAYVAPRFDVTTSVRNLSEEILEDAVIAVVPQEGIDIIDSDGDVVTGHNFKDPYYIPLVNTGGLEADGVQPATFTFDAKLTDRTQYRKITFYVYDSDDLNNVQFTEENLLSVEDVYVYCPTAVEPSVEFFTVAPEVVYSTGFRNITIYGENFDLLADKSRYGVTLSGNGGADLYDIPADNITVSTGDNTIILHLNFEVVPGQYEVIFNYNESGLGALPADGDKTLPKIPLAVSEKTEFAPVNFGLATIELVEGTGGDDNGTEEYEIKGYYDEADFEENSGDVYLTFRGQFDFRYAEAGDGSKYIERVEGVSIGNSNVMTVNNSLDVESGSLIIENKGGAGSVTTSIDANVYTSGARTSVWRGVSAITTLEAGTAYELTTYKINGDELAATQNIGYAKPIMLIWPGAASYLQKIAGLAFELRYAQFGEYQLEGGGTREVVSFGAKMDLSFLIPSNLKRDELQLTALETAQYKLAASQYDAVQLIAIQQMYEHDESLRADAKGGAFGVYVNNILFGGEFIGFNADVEVGIPPYAEGLADINGTLHVAIMNEYYEFGLKGSTSLLDEMKFGAEIQFKSKNMIPVPDKLMFEMSGLTPGIPVDPFGVIWIQGLGGGISNMYNSFFGTEGPPPIKLSLMGEVGIFSTLTGGVRAAVSPRSVEFGAFGIGIKGIDVIDSMDVRFIWYPDIFISGEMQVGIFGIINGRGYIVYVAEQDLVEMFASGSINVPSQVPIIGGMAVAHVDFGISNQRVWGVAELLKIGIGVVYYWSDGSVQVLTDTETLPTPSYASLSAIPVSYDAVNDRTLYADITGGVFHLADQTVEGEGALSPLASIEGTGLTSASITSNAAKSEHTVNLGTAGDTNGILTMQFDAESEAEAKTLAENITVNIGGTPYSLTFFVNETSDTVAANASANAKVSYNKDTGKADVTVTFTEDSNFGKDIAITTPANTDMMLYGVKELPSITDVIYTDADKRISWSGTKLDEYDSLTVYAEDMFGNLTTLWQTTNSSIIQSGSANITIPETLPGNTYAVILVGTITGEMNTMENAAGILDHTNPYDPTEPNGVSLAAGGDYTIDISGLPTDVDGYIVSIETAAGEKTDFTDLYATASGTGSLTVGGKYTSLEPISTESLEGEINVTEFEEVERGLTAGSYKVRVTTYNDLPSGEGQVTSRSVLSPAVTIEDAEVATVSARYSVNTTDVEHKTIDGTVMVPTVATRDLTVTASIEGTDDFRGTWTLLEGETAQKGNVSGKSFDMALSGLEDGMKTIEIVGETAKGDKVHESIVFVVDATAPVLQLASPTSGGAFNEDGTVTITGYTDHGSTLLVSIDGNAQTEYPVTGDSFSQEITGLPSKDVVTLMISAEDEFGNISDGIELKLINSGLTKTVGIGADKKSGHLGLFVNGVEYTNKHLPKQEGMNSIEVVPMFVTVSGTNIELTSEVTYTSEGVLGSVAVDNEGKVTFDNGARGLVTASLYSGAMEATAIVGDANFKNVTVVNSTGSGTYEVGATVSITAETKAGQTFSHWTSSDIAVANPNANPIVFTMPDKNISITANYTTSGGTDGSGHIDREPSSGSSGTGGGTIDGFVLADWQNPFSDISSSAWYYEAVGYMHYHKLMAGTSDTTFSPNEPMTRGMFVTVLGRMEGVDVAKYSTSNFDDVADGMWYTPYVAWANDNGIVEGMSATTFAPNELVTREQMAVILSRHAKSTGKELPKTVDEVTFADQDKISSWAQAAVSEMQQVGIVSGRDGNIFDPLGSATRAEGATMLMRFREIEE